VRNYCGAGVGDGVAEGREVFNGEDEKKG